LLFLSTGVLVALTMSVLGFPYERKGWEARLVHAALGGLRMACAVFCCPAKMNGLSPRSTRSVHLAWSSASYPPKCVEGVFWEGRALYDASALWGGEKQ
jgi:hypothetical protein